MRRDKFGNNNLEIQVLAVGKCWSSAGRIRTFGKGWNASSLGGKDFEPVQKKRRSY